MTILILVFLILFFKYFFIDIYELIRFAYNQNKKVTIYVLSILFIVFFYLIYKSIIYFFNFFYHSHFFQSN